MVLYELINLKIRRDQWECMYGILYDDKMFDGANMAFQGILVILNGIIKWIMNAGMISWAVEGK